MADIGKTGASALASAAVSEVDSQERDTAAVSEVDSQEPSSGKKRKSPEATAAALLQKMADKSEKAKAQAKAKVQADKSSGKKAPRSAPCAQTQRPALSLDTARFALTPCTSK